MSDKDSYGRTPQEKNICEEAEKLRRAILGFLDGYAHAIIDDKFKSEEIMAIFYIAITLLKRIMEKDFPYLKDIDKHLHYIDTRNSNKES